MDRFTFEQLDSILRRVLEISDEQRNAFLDETCGNDLELRVAAQRMLESAEADDPLIRPGGALSSAIWEGLRAERSMAPGIDAGERVGAYRILRRLGRGGMASVYLAERADGQFEQAVALKVLDAVRDVADLFVRFQQERQILASLDHPNIARLLDGGVTPSGQSYVVLEYVEGEPIDVYCDRRRFRLRERLELFSRVLEAVHCAHSNLVIHRDIKASNILVTAAGVPKLLDFGIAKLLDPSTPHAAPETLSALHPMTPEYASPEQVRGQPLTTASDIYQLGFLFYQLMTGRPPYPIDRRNYVDTLEAICRRDPVRPSQVVLAASHAARLAASREAILSADVICRARSSRPEQLRRYLRGDLDAIALKALRKEPLARYASAEAFAEDIQRYLSGLPVTARRGTVGYLTRKFVRRHRSGVAASAALIVMLGVFGALHTVQLTHERNRAQLEADKANQVVGFLMSLFEATDPREAGGEPITAQQLLEDGLDRAKTLEAQPEVQAQMLDVVGRVYRTLGEYQKARSTLERSLTLRRQLFGEEHVEVAATMDHLGRVFMDQGDSRAAIRLFKNALSVQRAQLGNHHADVAESLNNLGGALSRTGDYAAAEDAYREALAIRRELFGDEHADVATTMNNLGLLLMEQGRYDEAEAMHRQTLAMRRRLFGNVHLDITYSLNNLALVLHKRGDYEAAEALYRELLEMDRELLGERHPEVAMDLNNLAGLLGSEGEYDEAIALHRQALAMRRELLGDDHPHVAMSLNNLGWVLEHQHDYEGAEALYREALRIRRVAFGDEHPLVANVLDNLGGVLEAKGDYEAAEVLQQQALAIRQKALGDQHQDVAISLHSLAALLDRKGDHTTAEGMHRKAVAISVAALGDTHWQTASFRSALAACLLAQGHYREAESLLLAAHAVLKGGAGDRGPAARQTNQRLVALYEAWGRPDEAESYRALLTAQVP